MPRSTRRAASRSVIGLMPEEAVEGLVAEALRLPGFGMDRIVESGSARTARALRERLERRPNGSGAG